MSVIDEQIYDFDYYVKKLPLYLQNSDGFIEHFRIWHDILTTMVETEDEILNLINVFDDNYLTIINEMDSTGNNSDILDKLGSIFNVKRKFSLQYYDESELVSSELTLNNEEFLLLIRAQIIKNYSNGSYIQMRQFYDNAGLSIYFMNDGGTLPSGTVYVHLVNITGAQDYSENIQKMFLSGLLTIESMGINYEYTITNLDELFIWDKEVDAEGNYGWDKGVWTL